MTLRWDRTEIAGGHVEVAEAEVKDGKVIFTAYYQHLADEWFEPVAEVCTNRQATLNGGLVVDPKYAQRLLDEAMAQCCSFHGRNCEPPSELCCSRCTEADHPGHTRLGPCSSPDLS